MKIDTREVGIEILASTILDFKILVATILTEGKTGRAILAETGRIDTRSRTRTRTRARFGIRIEQ